MLSRRPCRPLGTTRFKQYTGPSPQGRSHHAKRGKGRRGKAGSPGLPSGSEGEEPELSASEAEQLEEEEAEEQPQPQRRRTAPPAEPAAAAAAEGASVRTTSGRAVRPPRGRQAEAAAVTSPDLAAAEAAQVAEWEAVEAFRRQTQLPSMPGSLSLFKAAPVAALPQAPPPLHLGQPALLLPGGAVQQGGTASCETSSDASAYSQPQPGLAPGAATTASSVPAYGVPAPLPSSLLASSIDAGLAQLPARLVLPGVPVPSAMAAGAWPQTPQHVQPPAQHWAGPLPPCDGQPVLPGLPLP